MYVLIVTAVVIKVYIYDFGKSFWYKIHTCICVFYATLKNKI